MDNMDKKKLAKYLIEEFPFLDQYKEFGNLLQNHTFDEICDTLAYQIVERRIKDKFYGEFIN